MSDIEISYLFLLRLIFFYNDINVDTLIFLIKESEVIQIRHAKNAYGRHTENSGIASFFIIIKGKYINVYLYLDKLRKQNS